VENETILGSDGTRLMPLPVHREPLYASQQTNEALAPAPSRLLRLTRRLTVSLRWYFVVIQCCHRLAVSFCRCV